MIWFTSDWHFNHNKDFVYVKRGFNSIDEMNEALINRHNALVKPDDIVYFLGDAMLGDVNGALNCLRRLNGRFYVIVGNHDTENKLELIKSLYDWNIVGYATVIKENGLRFYLSHYPTLTASPMEDKKLKSRTICLHGHTHQRDNFYQDNPYIYHVGVDSHDCTPISIEQIIEEIQNKEKGC